MYNAPLLRHLTDRKVPLQIIPPSTETGLGLSRSAFVDTAILMGTDFVRKLDGIGPATAIRLMLKYGSIEQMLEHEPKFRPADVAEYIEEVRDYLHMGCNSTFDAPPSRLKLAARSLALYRLLRQLSTSPKAPGTSKRYRRPWRDLGYKDTWI